MGKYYAIKTIEKLIVNMAYCRSRTAIGNRCGNDSPVRFNPGHKNQTDAATFYITDCEYKNCSKKSNSKIFIAEYAVKEGAVKPIDELCGQPGKALLPAAEQMNNRIFAFCLAVGQMGRKDKQCFQP